MMNVEVEDITNFWGWSSSKIKSDWQMGIYWLITVYPGGTRVDIESTPWVNM
jgi:hypothetical protein